ncbi:serine hydrolase [Synechocystis sp. B12]|nr:serine hydrolase [Synechocystis sp. B12]
MKLAEMGQINLDDPVLSHLRRWQFPADSPYRGEVTIAQLLSHTGGQNDHLGYGGFLPGQPLQTLEQSLTLTKDVAFGEPRGWRQFIHREKSLATPGAVIPFCNC